MNDERIPNKGQGDYQYLVPMDDSSQHLMVRLARRRGRIIERVKDADVVRKNLGMALYRTGDDRGRVRSLKSKYEHSQEWQYPFGPGYLGRVGIRYQKAKGAVKTYDRYGGEHTVHVEVDTGMTMTEMKENSGQVRRLVEDAAADKWCEIRNEAWDEEVPV